MFPLQPAHAPPPAGYYPGLVRFGGGKEIIKVKLCNDAPAEAFPPATGVFPGPYPGGPPPYEGSYFGAGHQPPGGSGHFPPHPGLGPLQPQLKSVVSVYNSYYIHSAWLYRTPTT